MQTPQDAQHTTGPRPQAEPFRWTAERVRILHDQAPVGIKESTLDGTLLRVNDRFCQILGYERSELLGMRLQDLVHADDALAERRFVEQVRLGELPSYRIEKQYRCKDGHAVWVEMHGFIAREDGEPHREVHVAIVQDIDARKQMEAALRASEARFRALADGAPVLLWMLEADGSYFFNRAYSDFVGVNLADADEGTRTQFYHYEDRDRALDEFRRAVHANEPYRSQFRMRRADGEYRSMQTVGIPRSAPGGPPAGYVGATFDITELRQAEDELRRADRAKNDFIGLLAHELRNPLAPLHNVVHLLNMGERDESTIAWSMGIVDRQVRTIARMVDDLLDVSRVTRGKLQLQRERTDLVTVVNSAVERVHQRIEERQQTLTVSMAAGPLYKDADPVRLEQVFANLLGNACKFTPVRGHIEISVTGAPNSDGTPGVLVTVTDDGVGIRPDLLAHVFDMFTQGDQSLIRQEGGLGIGLALARSLVELHGGTIRAHSDGIGRGAEFSVWLPTEKHE